MLSAKITIVQYTLTPCVKENILSQPLSLAAFVIGMPAKPTKA